MGFQVIVLFVFCTFQSYCWGGDSSVAALPNTAFKVTVYCHPGTADELTVEKTSILKSRLSSVLLQPDRFRSTKNLKNTEVENEATSSLNSCNICECIYNSFPNGIKDGKYILGDISGEDQITEGDTQHPVYVKPPKCAGEKPLKVTIKSKAKEVEESEEVSSVEKLGEVKKHVQRMVHVANIFDQVDQYLSHRVKILVNNMAKLISEDEI